MINFLVQHMGSKRFDLSMRILMFLLFCIFFNFLCYVVDICALDIERNCILCPNNMGSV